MCVRVGGGPAPTAAEDRGEARGAVGRALGKGMRVRSAEKGGGREYIIYDVIIDTCVSIRSSPVLREAMFFEQKKLFLIVELFWIF